MRIPCRQQRGYRLRRFAPSGCAHYGCACKSPDETFRQKLVPVKVGIGADGQATPALVKKMAALGINCAVTDLERVDDGKNEQLYYEGVRQGVELASGLQHALEYAVKHLPIPKVMTYQLADGVTTVPSCVRCVI